MISLEIIDNILQIEDLNLESNLKQLNARDKRNLSSIKAIKVEEKAYVHRELPAVLKNFLLKQLDDNKVYWVLMEPYPQAKKSCQVKERSLLPAPKALGEKHLF